MWSELQAEVETWTWVDWGIVFFALWLAWHFFTELLSGIAKAIAQGAAEGRYEVEKERALRDRQD